MNPMRTVRRAWAAFLGAVALGYGYLFLMPPLSSRTTDTLVAWVMVALGGVVGFVLEAWFVSMVRARRATDGSEETAAIPSKGYARS